MPFDSDIICCVLCQRNGATRCPFCGLGFHAACERKLLTIGQSTGLMDTLASADAGLVESIQKNKVPMPVSLPAENDWWSLLADRQRCKCSSVIIISSRCNTAGTSDLRSSLGREREQLVCHASHVTDSFADRCYGTSHTTMLVCTCSHVSHVMLVLREVSMACSKVRCISEAANHLRLRAVLRNNLRC